jgi:YbgC/YbaW family acyl-CoA thioester hydrolase
LIDKEYRVVLADTDASGRIFFAAVPDWFHGLWEDFLIEKKFPTSKLLKGEFHFPVVNMQFNYKASLTVGDLVTLKISKIEKSEKSFTIFYEALKETVLAIEGSLTHVCVDVRSGRSIFIPENFKSIFLS